MPYYTTSVNANFCKIAYIKHRKTSEYAHQCQREKLGPQSLRFCYILITLIKRQL